MGLSFPKILISTVWVNGVVLIFFLIMIEFEHIFTLLKSDVLAAVELSFARFFQEFVDLWTLISLKVNKIAHVFYFD